MKSGIWDDYGEWDEIASGNDVSRIKSKITGDGISWKPNFCSPQLSYVFSSLVEHSDFVDDAIPTVLDFGCGLGRNGQMLQRHFPRVVGFDLPQMVKHLGASPAAKRYDAIYENINVICANEKVHLIYDSVVFQHFADKGYCQSAIEALVAMPSLNVFVSIRHGLIPRESCHVLNVLVPMGWKHIHSEIDTLSFDGEAHELVVMKRA
ncbi:class I SAM-dependent methyltransferase [Agrobacterium rosae]|uniref:class I SAM-dependent methyltransferase n=1 Tax=Agrobacterium rosae TaxID=1972867 RepID=UPI00122EC3B7|nr:class I SAM-dependent methyltransferase [Agrobacterium rosae]